MSDSVERNFQNQPTQPAEAEDESIIDLVEEIEGLEENEAQSSSDPLSALEQQLLGLDAAEPPSNDLADLGGIDFDEEEDPTAGDRPSLQPATGEADEPLSKKNMDWLFAPAADASCDERDNHPETPSAAETKKTTEFDEPDPGTNEMLEAATPSATETEPVNEDDDLELIEVEDDEVDNELVWFDDLNLDQQPPPAESMPEASAAKHPLFAGDPDFFPETSAADVFAANLAAGLTETGSAPAVPPPPEAVIPDTVPLPPPIPTLPTQPSAPEPPPIDESALSLSAEAIDAAVERVIERRLGGTIEAIVRQAVETAVSTEIQRLKALLLEDDPGDRTP